MTKWNSIPELWLALMIVIDTWEHHILKVPTECAVLHSNVHPGSVDA